ncbi:MAG: hypothetical protein HRU25_10635 [Psychrobium sp.]|nr:hypothetical protein [Psychrobium sp.]
MKFYKTLTCIAISTALAACGSSSKKNEPVITPDPDPTPVERVVEGIAIKGLLTNAVVSVFKYVDSKAVALTDKELKEAIITTDETGSYTITLLDYQGPVKVEIKPSTDNNKPTMMLCDAPIGCGDVAFGSAINLTISEPDFTLSAISVIGAGAEPVKVNISAVTHLATQVVEAKDTIDASSVNETLSAVANSLGISGDINTLEPTNTNDATAVANEDNEAELHYGLINAGIAQALFSDTASGSMTEKLAQAASDLVANDGSFLAIADGDDSSFELSLTQILEGAAAVTRQLIKDPALASNTSLLADLEQETVDLGHEILIKKESADADGRITPVADSTTDGDAIAKGQALVSDIRVLANLFDLTKISGQDVDNKGNKFVELTRAASDMINAEANSITLLSEISMAVADIANAHEQNPSKTNFLLEDYRVADSTASGTIIYNMATHTYSADVVDGATTAKLQLAAKIGDNNQSIDVSMSGTVTGASATFTLAESSNVSLDFGQTITLAMLQDDEFNVEPVGGELTIDVQLVQKATDTVTNPITFAGKISAKLVTLATPQITEIFNRNGDLRVRMNVEQLLLPEMFSLSGSVSDNDSDGLSIMLTVAAPDIASHQTAGFAIDGISLADYVKVTASDDGNTITTTFKDAFTETTVYSAGENPGEWQFITTRVSDADGESSAYSEYFTMTETPLGKAYLLASYSKNWADNFIFSPQDEDGDGTADYYTVDYIGNDVTGADARQSDYLNDNNQLLNPDGSLATIANADYSNSHQFDDIFNNYYDKPLDQIDTAAALLDTLTMRLAFNDENKGWIAIEPTATLGSLANAESRNLNAFIVYPTYPEQATITIADSGNNVKLSIKDQLVYQWTYTSNADLPGNFTLVQSSPDSWGNITVVATTASVNLDVPKLTIVNTSEYSTYIHTETPIDNNNDGIADTVKICDIWNSAGQNDGEADCYDNNISALYNEQYFGSSSFNPMTLDSAVDVLQSTASNYWNVGTWIDDIGYLAFDLNQADLAAIDTLGTSDATLSYGARLTNIDSGYGLESADNYINASAKLTVKVILGDYNVELDVSANRTAIEAADVAVTATYQVPGEDTQRSFSINFSTDNDDKITVTNSEGVTIILTKPTDETSTQVELGTVMVGDDQVAKIVSRDGTILIIYSDGSVKSL